jgi:thiol-disulfide isomerase/thioredoxin
VIVPVVALAIVLASILGGGSSNEQPAETTRPNQAPASTEQSTRGQPSPSRGSSQTGGARLPNSPLRVLDAGTSPKALSGKIGPASSDGAISFGELRGSPIVLNLWSADCLPCRSEAPVLQAEWERLGARGVLFLGLNVLDTPAIARRFLASYDVTYPSVEQDQAATARALGATGVPETFFVSTGGKLVAHVIGTVSLGQIERGVHAAQTDQPLPTERGGVQIPLR